MLNFFDLYKKNQIFLQAETKYIGKKFRQQYKFFKKKIILKISKIKVNFIYVTNF
jgi:hypothetical protein